MASSSGKYYPEVSQGLAFFGSTAAAGVAFPLGTAAGVAATVALWNTSTTRNAVLLSLTVGYTSGTIAIGDIGIGVQPAGFAVGTTAPITAFTNGIVNNCLVGAGNSSAMRFTGSTATLTAGTTNVFWLGSSMEIATAAPGVSTVNFDFNGQLILTPGQVGWVVGSVAQTGLFTISLIWAEIPTS